MTALSLDGPPTPGRTAPRWALLVAPLLVLALLARLVPVLRGGGLTGYGNYDDGVYFAAAVGLVDGRMPYADVLVLHPPAVLLALAPFAALTRVVSDPTAFAVARVAWMLLGVLNCWLVIRVLRSAGRTAALTGGLVYAVFYPAVYSEHTTLLEAPANTVLLLALLVARDRSGRWRERPMPWLFVGLLVGLSPTFKIWGVVPVAVIALWLAARRRWRPLGAYLVGGVGALVVVLGPFAITAPGRMWRLVVSDQLGRSSSGLRLGTRMEAVVGLGDVHPSALRLGGLGAAPGTAFVLVTGLVWLVLAVAAVVDRRHRLFVVLHAGMVATLLATPIWFAHYAAFVAATAALVAGAGTGALVDRVGPASALFPRRSSSPRRWSAPLRWRRLTPGPVTPGPVTPGPVAPVLVVAVLVVVVLVPAVGLGRSAFGAAFPRARLAAAVGSGPGCITTDDPLNLIELDVLSRNLARGCPLVVDLGGYSYDRHPAGATVPRRLNQPWQQLARSYLSTGNRVVLSRFTAKATTPFDDRTKRLVKSWKRLAGSGHTVVRAPAHAGHVPLVPVPAAVG